MNRTFRFSYLEANPHYYDYFHYLHFAKGGSVKFADGAGQMVNSVAEGKYNILQINSAEAKVEFFDVSELNIYQKNEKTRDINFFSVSLKKEEGIFAFAQEVVWRIENEDDYPCLLYRTRYVFETDPLFFVRERQQENLYYKIEKKNLFDSTRFYYAKEDKEELSLKKIISLGINKELIFCNGAEKPKILL